MIVTFCGHSEFYESDILKERILEIFEKEIDGKDVDFYLGGYGKFDFFIRKICKEYQEKHCNAKLYFVTPYIEPEYFKNREYLKYLYDGIISMNTENAPKRLRIIRRNYEMVKACNLVIAYVYIKIRSLETLYFLYMFLLSSVFIITLKSTTITYIVSAVVA